jgi:DNA repair exonuclease SbcCD ATPase subunit
MKITMTNFRCHVNSTFEIPDLGMILLSGDGGAGKSTVLLGIIYALYGKMPMKVKKTTHGRTTCKVVLEYKGMEITRTKPTIVTLRLVKDNGVDGDPDNEKGDSLEESTTPGRGPGYEGDQAQGMIEKRIGMTYEEFVVGAFVHGRRSGTSVVSMTPTEQLNFVSVLSRESALAAAEIKDKIKQKKKDLDQELLKLQGETNSLNKQKEEMETSITDSTIFILPDISPDELREKIVEFESTLKQTNKDITLLSTRVEKERVAKKKREEVQKKIDALTTEIKQLRSMLISIKIPSQHDMDSLAEEILSYQSTIEHYEAYISYMKDKSVLQEAIDAMEEGTNQRLQEIEGIVMDDEELERLREHAETEEEYAKKYAENLKIYENTIAKKEEAKIILASIFHKIKSMRLANKKIVDAIKTPNAMIAFLKSMVAKYKENHHRALLSTMPKYQCPGCQSMVTMCEDNLVLCDDVDDEIDTDPTTIDSLKTSIIILEKYIQDIEIAAKDFNVTPIELGEEPASGDPGQGYTSLYKDYFTGLSLREEYNSLMERALPPAIENMKSRIEEMESKFKDEGDVAECTEYLKQLKHELQEKTAKQESTFAAVTEYQNHEATIRSKEILLNKLKDSTPGFGGSGVGPNSLTILEEKLNKSTRKIVDLNNSISKHRESLDGLAEYEAQLALTQSIEELATKIEEVKTVGEGIERQLEGSYGLEEAAKEAEILVLEETTNTINVNAKTYLDLFFKLPISVRLVCIKNTKTAAGGYKLQFNTVIEYEGSVYDSVDELSDSERQRCELAFLFAVNDMVRSPILIMDESVNCMSPEMNMDMLNLIHDLCGHKLVLMIAHEAVRGVFDAEVPITHTNA